MDNSENSAFDRHGDNKDETSNNYNKDTKENRQLQRIYDNLQSVSQK